MTDDITGDAPDHPQICLITPPEVDLATYPALLSTCMDAVEISCLRLSLSSQDEIEIGRIADNLRQITDPRDIPIVIEDHGLIAQRHGLDGVHLTDGARSVAKWRKELGDDAIVGAFCGTSRHVGLNAGEIGADYAAFGPIGATALGGGDVVDPEFIEWWSMMIEVPMIVEGALDEALIRKMAPFTDFVALGQEIWSHDDPAAQLKLLAAAML
ncbi:MAG: thiamine phosphate synthase [Rhodobacteraceae bacterium]|nr:thiamine phosphate synthase [Paracoccaceae bacterium]